MNNSLIEEVAKGDLNKVKELLKKGADINFVSEIGYTALHGCSISNYIDIAKLLISSNANIEAVVSKYGFTPLHFAAQEGNFEIVKLLVEAGANVNAKDNIGNGPLFRAGNKEIIGKYLIDNGADITMENEYGISPLNAPAMAYNYIKNLN